MAPRDLHFVQLIYNLEALCPRVVGVCKVSPPGTAETRRAALPLHTACWVCSAGRQAEDAVSLTKADKLAPRFPLRDEKWNRVEVAGCWGEVLAGLVYVKRGGETQLVDFNA